MCCAGGGSSSTERKASRGEIHLDIPLGIVPLLELLRSRGHFLEFLTGCWWQRHTQGSTTLGMGGQGAHPAQGEHLDLSTFPVHRNLGWVVMCWGLLMPSPPGAGMLVQFQTLSQLVVFILRSA